jgi:hypothetical protein
MKISLVMAAIVVVLVLWYALVGRPWLKAKPWARHFFAAIEPIEIALYKKSETILWARLKMVVGAALTILTTAGSIDVTPIMPLVPEAYQGAVHTAINLLPLLITVVGMIDEKLRNTTTKPIELVAVPDNAVPPAVGVALARADLAKLDAVAAVTNAKAV